MNQNEQLTGRSKPRLAFVGPWWRRKSVLVIQVELYWQEWHDQELYTYYDWRDADVSDYIVYATAAPPLAPDPPPLPKVEPPPAEKPKGFAAIEAVVEKPKPASTPSVIIPPAAKVAPDLHDRLAKFKSRNGARK